MSRAVLLLALLTLSGAVPVEVTTTGTCVLSRAEVRANYGGYDHVVVLDNRCEGAQLCVVTTDVNPARLTAEVPGNRIVEVLTFRASPASTFRYAADCRPK